MGRKRKINTRRNETGWQREETRKKKERILKGDPERKVETEGLPEFRGLAKTWLLAGNSENSQNPLQALKRAINHSEHAHTRTRD